MVPMAFAERKAAALANEIYQPIAQGLYAEHLAAGIEAEEAAQRANEVAFVAFDAEYNWIMRDMIGAAWQGEEPAPPLVSA